jgi:hypothetical protein
MGEVFAIVGMNTMMVLMLLTTRHFSELGGFFISKLLIIYCLYFMFNVRKSVSQLEIIIYN